jgi:hypothetical protein
MNEVREYVRHLISVVSRARGIDGPLAVLIAGGAVLLFAFIKLAEEVMEGETRTFDGFILLDRRTPCDISQPIRPLWLQEMVRDLPHWEALAC